MSSLPLIPMVLAVFFHQFLPRAYSSTFTIRNKCTYQVSLGILFGAGTPELSTKGFLLQPGESTSLSVPTSWSGRLRGCTLCTQDSSGKFARPCKFPCPGTFERPSRFPCPGTFASPGKFSRPGKFARRGESPLPANFPCPSNFPCLTGDDGYSTMACSGGGAAPPATLAKFTFNGAGGLDFYDVSLVEPMMVAPHGGTGYAANLSEDCPVELKIIDGNNEEVAGKSGCNAFRDPQYCCSGACTSPNTCNPSSCSEFFKNACPQACCHSYDDGTSTFTCVGADGIITFCPGLSTRLILIANAAETKPCTYKKFAAETKLFPAETKPCTHNKFPARTEPFPAETKPCSHVVHVVPRNRRLLGIPTHVNVHSPPSTSNEKSWNLDKEDPPTTPLPRTAPTTQP